MPSQFFGLNIGASALFAYQSSLNTTANNIANVKTEGYSRQETELEAGAPLRVYAKYGSTGTGVNAVAVKQQRDIYYDTKYWQNSSTLGYFEQKLYYLSQVENVFADDGVQEGFSTVFSKMFNGLDSLNGGNASDESVRNQFIHQAQNLCIYFNSVADSLRETQKDCNEEINSTIQNINSISEKLSLLNKEINKLEVNGGYANELRDQRALLLDELAGIVDVKTDEYAVKNTYGKDLGGTNFTVFINGQLLVDGTEYRQLECISSETKKNQTDADGMYDIIWTDTKTAFAATTETANGTLKALFDLRDGNNNEGMYGAVKSVNKDPQSRDYPSITLAPPSNSDIHALNIPAEGTIEVNARTIKYTSWTAKLDDQGNITEITFELEEPLKVEDAMVMTGKPITVGKRVDSMGIPYYQQQINEFLRNFTEMFNDIQKQGQTLDGDPMGAFFVAKTGTDKIFDFEGWGKDEDILNGQPIREISSTSNGYHQMTAFNATVNDKSIKDPAYFSTTKDVTNGADAVDLLKDMMDLQANVTMFRGDNAEAFLETLLSDIAVDTEKNTVFYKNYFNMKTVISNQRMSVSGVDEDEEALNLVKFQNAYNLSSKVISVMSEIYDKLINETGVT
ncbi:MAG: flagellar hook-associated protein FlgK [Agathobacter sp.]|nr:flagellar hook-associated protein FlgK [Agathobacter sp.]